MTSDTRLQRMARGSLSGVQIHALLGLKSTGCVVAALCLAICLAFATGIAAAQTTQRHVGSGTWSSQTYVSASGSSRFQLPRVYDGSFVPGVGEAMDVALLFDGDAAWWERGLAAVSLGASIVTGGMSPNAGAIRAAAEGAEWTVEEGTRLYRVFGGESRGMGEYFTTVDPSTVADFRRDAGLYPGNAGSHVLEATLANADGVELRAALPGPNNVGGGLAEVYVPNAAAQVVVNRVSGLNPSR